MTFKLTANTDPSTVMFEGHPEVTIASIEPALHGFFVKIGSAPPGTVFGTVVIKPGNNHNHDDTGLDRSTNSNNIWPRVVPRFKFTLNKPIIATSDRDGTVYHYEYVGTFTPADGSEPVIHLRRTTQDSGYGNVAQVYASTGRIIAGSAGSALAFSNGPEITRRNALIEQSDGAKRGIYITETDGRITGVELV